MSLINEPRPMRQNFIDIIKVPEFLRDMSQSFQPCFIPSLPNKLLLLEIYQVTALMPSCSLLNLLERIRIYKDKIALF
jgi:hypothetical protein